MSGGTQLANDAYGHTVFFSTDGVTDTYLVGNASTYQFPAGTSAGVVYVSIAIQFNLAQAQIALQTWINARYSSDVRWNLNAVYTCAVAAGLTNRAAYVFQLMTWGAALMGYSAAYIATVQAMTNPATIAATTPDFTHSAQDPLINPFSAMAITT
jgi:hypothetical protein